MALTLAEKIEAISSDLTALLVTPGELATEGDHLRPLADELWSLNHQAEEVHNSIYGLWSNTSEEEDYDG